MSDPEPPDPRAVRFEADHRPYRQVVLFVVLTTAVEIPAIHFLLGATMEPGPGRLALQVALALTALATAGWLLWDLRRLEAGGVYLEGRTLRVAYPGRASGVIPLERLRSASPCTVQRPNPLMASAGQKRRPPPGLFVTSAAPPNVTLELHAPVTLLGPLGRLRTASTLHLALREPEAFLKAVPAPGERR